MKAREKELLAELLIDAKLDVEELGKQFDAPDDDWLPYMLMTRTENGETAERGIVAIDIEFMRDSPSKDVLAEVMLPGVLRQFNATMAAFVTSAWTVEHKPDDELAGKVPPSEHPNRREAVHIMAMSGMCLQQASAEIIRHEDGPPTLAPWQDFPMIESPVAPGEKPEMMVQGRFVTPLRAALARQG